MINYVQLQVLLNFQQLLFSACPFRLWYRHSFLQYFDLENPQKETLDSINSTFELSCTCGYVTLINQASQKHSKLKRYVSPYVSSTILNNEQSETSSEDGFIKLTDDLPDNSNSNNSNNNADFLDICITKSSITDSEIWLPLQISFGIPLFDHQLNEKITRKVWSSYSSKYLQVCINFLPLTTNKKVIEIGSQNYENIDKEVL